MQTVIDLQKDDLDFWLAGDKDATSGAAVSGIGSGDGAGYEEVKADSPPPINTPPAPPTPHKSAYHEDNTNTTAESVCTYLVISVTSAWVENWK